MVLRFDQNARRSYLTVLKGTEVVSVDKDAPAPQITRTGYIYDLCLAEVRYPTLFRKGTRLIDTRSDESRCGLMRDGVTRIPELTIGTVTTGETASATIKNGVLSLVLPNGNGGSSTRRLRPERDQQDPAAVPFGKRRLHQPLHAGAAERPAHRVEQQRRWQ